MVSIYFKKCNTVIVINKGFSAGGFLYALVITTVGLTIGYYYVTWYLCWLLYVLIPVVGWLPYKESPWSSWVVLIIGPRVGLTGKPFRRKFSE